MPSKAGVVRIELLQGEKRVCRAIGSGARQQHSNAEWKDRAKEISVPYVVTVAV